MASNGAWCNRPVLPSLPENERGFNVLKVCPDHLDYAIIAGASQLP